MSWRRITDPGISDNSPPYRPLVRFTHDLGFKYTIGRTRSRFYDLAYGGWQDWEAWSDFNFFSPDCWFLGANVQNRTGGDPPSEGRAEYQLEVAAHGSPWAILWVNTITPSDGGATSTDEDYLLILPGATYTANFTAPTDCDLNLESFEIHYPAP